jgi:hypothetical protein
MVDKSKALGPEAQFKAYLAEGARPRARDRCREQWLRRLCGVLGGVKC